MITMILQFIHGETRNRVMAKYHEIFNSTAQIIVLQALNMA